MSWQKCPICDGYGTVWSSLLIRSSACPTCDGARIISTVSGLPPKRQRKEEIPDFIKKRLPKEVQK